MPKHSMDYHIGGFAKSGGDMYEAMSERRQQPVPKKKKKMPYKKKGKKMKKGGY